MSIPYHRPISAQLTQDEDYFLKDMPESILPPTPPQHEKGNSDDDGDAGQGARGDSNMSEEQIKELKRYREVIKGMGRELSNLQSTVTKLQTENQSLRKNSASDEQLMSIILTDPSVEVDSPEDFVERYVALKTRLEADLEEFKTYKDHVQKLQNQLIRANDREKNFLHFEVAHGNEEERVKPVNKERQKIRKLQYTVIQQENAIKNLEKALRDYLDRAERRRSAKSAVSSTSSKFGSTVTIRDPHQDAIAKLMEENARLREDIGDYRILMQEDDLKNVQLNEDLALSDQRIESLEAQLNQNEQNWACEKRELTVRLQEQKSNLAHSVNASVIDVGSRHAF